MPCTRSNLSCQVNYSKVDLSCFRHSANIPKYKSIALVISSHIKILIKASLAWHTLEMLTIGKLEEYVRHVSLPNFVQVCLLLPPHSFLYGQFSSPWLHLLADQMKDSKRAMDLDLPVAHCSLNSHFHPKQLVLGSLRTNRGALKVWCTRVTWNTVCKTILCTTNLVFGRLGNCKLVS